MVRLLELLSFRLTCPRFLLSKFASQLNLIQSRVGSLANLTILGINFSYQGPGLKFADPKSQGHRCQGLGSRVPSHRILCPRVPDPRFLGPRGPRSQSLLSQCPESQGLESQVPRSHVLILDYGLNSIKARSFSKNTWKIKTYVMVIKIIITFAKQMFLYLMSL